MSKQQDERLEMLPEQLEDEEVYEELIPTSRRSRILLT